MCTKVHRQGREAEDRNTRAGKCSAEQIKNAPTLYFQGLERFAFLCCDAFCTAQELRRSGIWIVGRCGDYLVEIFQISLFLFACDKENRLETHAGKGLFAFAAAVWAGVVWYTY